MNYNDWLKTIPLEITSDLLWRMSLYRQALFLGDIAWHDATKLIQDKRTVRVSDQLYRATGKISSNIAEGYSKASGKDQARYYEYALGSARESRDWYFKSRFTLGEAVAQHRMRLTVELIRQLLKLVPQHRGKKIQEEQAIYQIYTLEDLLNDVPMPE